jgi:hypothetical protein
LIFLLVADGRRSQDFAFGSAPHILLNRFHFRLPVLLVFSILNQPHKCQQYPTGAVQGYRPTAGDMRIAELMRAKLYQSV